MSVKYGDVLLNYYAEVQPIHIHKRLMNVNGVEKVDVSTMGRWVRRFQSGDKDVIDLTLSHPSTATNKENEERFDNLIKFNRRKIVNEISTELGVSVSAEEKLIPSLKKAKDVPDGVHECSPRNKKPPGDCQ